MQSTPLVSQYLETISGDALDRYQTVIREYVRRRHGIYALYRKDRLYYVGLAKDLRNRLKNHLRDKHKGRWDRFSVYLTVGDSHLRELESLVLRILQPTGNSQRGKFKKAQDLKRKLKRDLTAHHKRELDEVFNRRLRVSVDETPSRSSSLSGMRFKLRGLYKGKTYRARLLKNGNISFGGKRYGSLSEAAKAATGRSMHGWSFWRYERAPGDWVRIRELKR